MVVVAPLGSVEVPILVTNEGATEDTLPSARVVAMETGLENVDSGWVVDVIVAVVLGPSRMTTTDEAIVVVNSVCDPLA